MKTPAPFACLATAPSAAGAGGWLSGAFEVYMPRRLCMRLDQDVIWTHVFADALIALSYFSIPFALVYFLRRRRDVEFGGLFWLFAGFIFACGLTHAVGVLNIWRPYYRLDGWVKAGTGIISAFTAVTLWRLMPNILRLPSPAQLRDVNAQLVSANAGLLGMQDELEARVRQRTVELEERNDQLRREVQAREEAEAGERALRREAERLNRVKDDFLSTLSHELRTPLNAVMGWAQLLNTGDACRDPDQVREAVGVIYRNARAQAQLVDDLLDVSRILAGRLRIERGQTTLGHVVALAREAILPAAEAKRITVDVHAVDVADARPIYVDAHRLQQVAWNLLSNAVKFTPREGRVTVTIAQIGSNMRLVVADTGRGIPADFLPRMFAPFEQLDQSTTRREGGLGLGLSIVRHLVELHGGTVSAASEGVGATFTVLLPIQVVANSPGEPFAELKPVWWSGASHAPTESNTAGADDRLAAPLSGLRVLVVEDEADSRQMLERVLRRAGAIVDSAADVPEAIGLLRDARAGHDGRPFDLLVSDIGLPMADGYELIRQWRAVESAAGASPTPALALTAYAREQDREQALAAGFDAHLAKPVDHDELVQQLAALRRGR